MRENDSKSNPDYESDSIRYALTIASKELSQSYWEYKKLLTQKIQNTPSELLAVIVEGYTGFHKGVDDLHKFYKNHSSRKKGGNITAGYWNKEKDKLYKIWKEFSPEVKKSNKLSLNHLSPKHTALSHRTLENYIRKWRKLEIN